MLVMLMLYRQLIKKKQFENYDYLIILDQDCIEQKILKQYPKWKQEGIYRINEMK